MYHFNRNPPNFLTSVTGGLATDRYWFIFSTRVWTAPGGEMASSLVHFSIQLICRLHLQCWPQNSNIFFWFSHNFYLINWSREKRLKSFFFFGIIKVPVSLWIQSSWRQQTWWFTCQNDQKQHCIVALNTQPSNRISQTVIQKQIPQRCFLTHPGICICSWIHIMQLYLLLPTIIRKQLTSFSLTLPSLNIKKRILTQNTSTLGQSYP